MGLSATEITNSTAGRFDVELRFYGGLTYSALTLSTYVAGAIDPSTSGWTNITARVNDAGSLTYERAGNSLRWNANLSGTQYSATYFAPGQAILCLRRILVAGVQTVPASGTWELWWLGQVTSGAHADDYKHGGDWTRSIGGLDSFLQGSTAPRLTAGRINLMAEASVTASSTLTNAALEAGTGEFVGTLVTVPASNTIDGNVNTLWISNGVPSTTIETPGTAMIQKVFCKPLAGYSQTKTWWIELYGNFEGGDWYLQTSADLYLHFNAGDMGQPVRDAWGAGPQHVIICASASDFTAYTGGAQGGAVIFDAKLCPTQGTFNSLGTGRDGTFTIDPDADWILVRRSDAWLVEGNIYATIVWNQDGSSVSIPGIEVWTGGAIDVSDDLCPPGSGIRILPSQDGGARGDYEITDKLFPGDDYTETDVEWLLYSLAQQSAVTVGAISAGATTITLNSTVGLLDSGSAICGGTDPFTYTGRTSTTLTGVSGIGNHANGASVYQTIGGVAQYGWPCSQLELLRPANSALPGIVAGRVYTLTSSLSAPATPGTSGWEAITTARSSCCMRPTCLTTCTTTGAHLTGPDGGPRWVQYVLVVFDEMTASARARLNECKVYLAQTQIDNSAAGDIAGITACGLAQYIFDQAGVSTGLSRGTSLDSGPFIGEHATAVAAFPQVLDDLARITGCIMDWGLAGVPTWWPDMWWPVLLADTQYDLRAALDATYLRGKAQYSGRKPNEVGVKVHARTPDGQHEYEVQFPPTMTAAEQRIELDDLIVTSVDMATQLAQTQYYKAGLHYTAGPQELTFTLKGPGEWLRPEQWVSLACQNSSGLTITRSGYATSFDDVGWLVESVTWEWGRQDAFRSWSATAKCRRYWR